MSKLFETYNIYLNYEKFQPSETFVLSVLFHEEITTVINYLINVLFFFKKYNVIILISCNEFISNFLKKTKLPPNIIVVSERPDNIEIWGNVNLFEQHVKNYLYLKNNNLNFDYFWFSASNDVFIKEIDENIKKHIVYYNKEESITLDIEEVNNFYKEFTINPGWFAYVNMLKDTHTIKAFIENKIIVKCNEIEGLILSNKITEEVFDFYIHNIFNKNNYKKYFIEEFFIASYLYSKYRITYNTVTLREKWCKYDEFKNIHGAELYENVLKNNDNLYCIKTIDRNYKNEIREKVREHIKIKTLKNFKKL